MKCRACGTENAGGRENCVICGQPLLDIHRVLIRDRWAARAVAGAIVGIFALGGFGALLGALAAFVFSSGVNAAVDAAFWGYIGWKIGSVLGAVIGGAINVLRHTNRY